MLGFRVNEAHAAAAPRATPRVPPQPGAIREGEPSNRVSSAFAPRSIPDRRCETGVEAPKPAAGRPAEGRQKKKVSGGYSRRKRRGKRRGRKKWVGRAGRAPQERGR